MELSLEDILGYVGLFFIATSFFFKNIQWLRVFNLIGAVIMTVYGIMLDSVPVAALNALIVVVNGYYLFQMTNEKSKFDLVEETYKPGSLFDLFHEEYEDDINIFFPKFKKEKVLNKKICLILRDLAVAGVYIYSERDREIYIHIDYVAPQYRDMSNSLYLLTKKSFDFKSRGFTTLVAESSVSGHQSYLKKLGFVRVNGTDRFEKDITKDIL